MLDLNEGQTYPVEPHFAVAFPSQRDSYIASTAVKIEQLQATVARLEREAEQARMLIANLSETVEQNHRFSTFQQNEKRLKELRVDDLLRCFKDVKSRLDRIEGVDRATVDISQSTFASVNDRLNALAQIQARQESASLGVRRNSLLLLMGIFGALVVLGLRLL